MSLHRNKSKGHNNFLNLGEVEVKVYSEGPDHSQIYVICRDGDTAIVVADAPKVAVAHEELFGNAGYQSTIVWQAKNEHHILAGGTTIKGAQDPLNASGSRRYFLGFESNGDLECFLKLLGISPEEWNDRRGRFYQEAYIMPANNIELDHNEMDFECEAQKKTMTDEELDHDPFEPSQQW